jgi:hypothetical protein
MARKPARNHFPTGKVAPNVPVSIEIQPKYIVVEWLVGAAKLFAATI